MTTTTDGTQQFWDIFIRMLDEQSRDHWGPDPIPIPVLVRAYSQVIEILAKSDPFHFETYDLEQVYATVTEVMDDETKERNRHRFSSSSEQSYYWPPIQRGFCPRCYKRSFYDQQCEHGCSSPWMGTERDRIMY